jgi:hypothetical protein
MDAAADIKDRQHLTNGGGLVKRARGLASLQQTDNLPAQMDCLFGVNLPFHTAVRSSRFAGYAGRRGKRFPKYILVDMYAKAVQGIGPSDAVKWPLASW